MGFKGKFTWIKSLHQGGRKAISFTLKNSNLLLPVTFDAAIVDGSNVIPTKYFRNLKLKAGQSVTFDIDNDSWDWAQGDLFAVLTPKGKIDEKWDLIIPTLAPGECKECHGDHKCATCKGTGKVLNRYLHTYEPCTVCMTTGICQTCFVPTRQNSPHSPIYSPVSAQSAYKDQKKIDQIRQQIQELQHKVYLLEQENLNLQRNGQILSLRSIYENNLNLKHRYTMEILNLQNTLNSLQ